MTNVFEAHEGEIIHVCIAARLKQPDISILAEIANDFQASHAKFAAIANDLNL